MLEARPKAIVSATSLCTSCPKLCRFSCPVAVADGRESSTPTAKMTLASRLSKGSLPISPESVEPLYRCTGCRLQERFCKHEVDAADSLEAARALAYERGALPRALGEKEARIRTDRDPLQAELAARAQAIGSRPSGPAELLLAGCRALTDDADGARRALALLEAVSGARAALWDRQPICCGYPLYALGDRAALSAMARDFSRACRDLPRLTILDPACGFTLRQVYPALGFRLKPELPMQVELLADRKAMLSIRSPSAERVVYHDPCHLGRRLGVYDAPRDLVDLTGATRVRAFWDREEARCSGFGALYPLLDPATARRIAADRAQELLSTGASRIATACPSCRLAFRLVGADAIDVTELLARAVSL